MAGSIKILILYYSFSGQTNGLLRRLQTGLEQKGHTVFRENIRPSRPLRFPVGTVAGSIKMMITTFFRVGTPIRELPASCQGEYDLIVLAGPTWSYNPSGPVLSLIKRDGSRLFNGKTVIPMISCRGYWRMHWRGLQRGLRKCGASLPNVIVFSHPASEPWRTIGVFLKIAGITPKGSSLLGRFYKHYGHSKKQHDEAERFGVIIGDTLLNGRSLSEINFQTPTALP
jgi:hypothetical protein